MALIPAEIPVTVNLHLDGKNRQWYSRGEAKASSSWSTRRSRTRLEPLMETLPLAKEQLMDREYIPVGPLMALRALMGARARQ
jgi:hypothetical protein